MSLLNASPFPLRETDIHGRTLSFTAYTSETRVLYLLVGCRVVEEYKWNLERGRKRVAIFFFFFSFIPYLRNLCLVFINNSNFTSFLPSLHRIFYYVIILLWKFFADNRILNVKSIHGVAVVDPSIWIVKKWTKQVAQFQVYRTFLETIYGVGWWTLKHRWRRGRRSFDGNWPAQGHERPVRKQQHHKAFFHYGIQMVSYPRRAPIIQFTGLPQVSCETPRLAIAARDFLQ